MVTLSALPANPRGSSGQLADPLSHFLLTPYHGLRKCDYFLLFLYCFVGLPGLPLCPFFSLWLALRELPFFRSFVFL